MLNKLKLSKKAKFKLIIIVFILLSFEILTRLIYRVLPTEIPTYSSLKTYNNQPFNLTTPRFTEHPFLPYIGTPNYKQKIPWQSVYFPEKKYYQNIQHNNLGFRTPERSFTKKKGTIRILTFGGSTTYGTGCSNTETWPHLLEEYLNDKLDQPVEVINFALDGANSAQSLVIYSLIGKHFDPDFVLVYHGVNDRWSWRGETIYPDYRHILKDYTADIKPALRYRIPSILLASRTVGLIVKTIEVIGNSPKTLFDVIYIPQKQNETLTNSGQPILMSNIQSMYDLAKSTGSSFLTATFHYYDESESDYALQVNLMRTYFQDHKIPYIDLAKTLPHLDKNIHTDFVHFSIAGNKLVADSFGKAIYSQLK